MIRTHTVLCQAGFRNVCGSILKPEEGNSRKVEQKQDRGQEEGKGRTR